MEKIKANENHKRLEVLAGTWDSEEKFEAGPMGPGGTFKGRMVSRIDLDGFLLIQDYTMEKDGVVTFSGHGILGWDEKLQNYSYFWFDSWGEIPSAPHRGKFEGDILTLELPNQSRLTYTIENADSHFLKIETSEDGGKSWKTMMDSHYVKAPESLGGRIKKRLSGRAAARAR